MAPSPPRNYAKFYLSDDAPDSLNFFKENKASQWNFESFSSNTTDERELQDYKNKLNHLLQSTSLPNDLKSYVGELKKHTVTTKSGKEPHPIPQLTYIEHQYNTQGSARFIYYTHPTDDTVKRKTSDLPETQLQPETSNKKLKYLEGRNFEDEEPTERIKWIVDKKDISHQLLQYRETCKYKAKTGELTSDIEEIALNGIFYISPHNTKYGIDNELYKKMVKELDEKYGVVYDKENIEIFQTTELRYIYKMAQRNNRAARQQISNLMFDNEGDIEMMCEATLNLMVQLDPDADEKNLEDRFKAKYVTPLLSPFLKEKKHLRLGGCDEESLGSKLRKEKFGRKSDNSYKVTIYNTQILLSCVKC
ncbi:unnamed protein product [Rhizopus stolonifer]